MSVVAVKVYKNRIEIASDSIEVRGSTQSKDDRNHGKLHKISKNMYIGYIGLAQDGMLLELFSKTTKPERSDESSVTEWIGRFIDWKRSKTNSTEINMAFILVYKNHVFCVQDFYVNKVTKYEAIGAGMDFSLAALHLGSNVEDAVKTACELSVYCELPVKKYIIET